MFDFLDRTEKLIGSKAINKLASSHVAVFLLMLISTHNGFHGGPAREKATAFQICPTGHCRQPLRQRDGNAAFNRTTLPSAAF